MLLNLIVPTFVPTISAPTARGILPAPSTSVGSLVAEAVDGTTKAAKAAIAMHAVISFCT